jgi:hypothetical protein
MIKVQQLITHIDMHDYDELTHDQKHNLELILFDLFSKHLPEVEQLP